MIRGVEAALAGNEDYIFAQRVNPRTADANRELHELVTSSVFAKGQKVNAFMLTWRAYDTDCGILAPYNDDLNAGRHVVGNVSRAVVGDAVAYFGPAVVIQVPAPPPILEYRLNTREDISHLEERLARIVMLSDVWSVCWKFLRKPNAKIADKRKPDTLRYPVEFLYRMLF